MARHILAIEAEAALDRERTAALPTLEVAIGAARSALKDRYDDLRWCGKDDDCHVKAEGVSVAIEDFEQAVRAAIAQEGSPVGLDAREALAAIEHDQWMTWAQSIMDSEPISEARRERWSRLMVPYAELDEPTKDHDRKWADIVLAALSDDVSPGVEPEPTEPKKENR
jgi:hypothetical protein